MDRAYVSLQKKTGSILPVDQCQTPSIGSESGVLLDKQVFLQAQMGRDLDDLFLGHPDKSRPATAGRAALAEVGGRHGEVRYLEV